MSVNSSKLVKIFFLIIKKSPRNFLIVTLKVQIRLKTLPEIIFKVDYWNKSSALKCDDRHKK